MSWQWEIFLNMAWICVFDVDIEKPWFNKPILINNLTPVFLMLIVKNTYFLNHRLVGAGKIENSNCLRYLFHVFQKKWGIYLGNLFLKKSKMMIPPRIELGSFCVLGRRDNRNTTESCAVVIPYEPSYSKHMLNIILHSFKSPVT